MNNKLLTISETSKILGISIDTLRRWDKKGSLKAFRPTPTGNRYYKMEDLEALLPTKNLETLSKLWANEKTSITPPLSYCATRDIFQARLEHMQNELAQIPQLGDTAYLLTAIAGEIGNNSFDHNLGNWPNIPGIIFSYDITTPQIILADRGQGILKTLRRIRPKIETHTEALKIAFTEILSGRAPEARGNGLKFVRQVVCENPIRLSFQTGDAILELQENTGNLHITKTKTKPKLRGCLAIINF